MESSTEGLSSTANHSFSGDGDGDGEASEESGWTSYIDYFMETQGRQKEEESSVADPSADDVGRRSTSECSAECAVGGSTRLPALVEPSEASRRLRLKKEGRTTKKVLYDESLEDTATSPISSPKLIELRDSDANHQSKEFSHSKKTTVDDKFGRDNHINNGNGANTTTDMIDHDGAYDNNELRKKGLCLVPVSAFHV
ncbi:vascular-related unknown protein 1-like [Phragmites australis]|uniref:vascular-related unknown protein 1-like n=1 Tax=Phragmites australis TaxID=29695 RepID=UPI002D76FC1B|nr:vascular-related unknown protein 1-like [Phragmites australis]